MIWYVIPYNAYCYLVYTNIASTPVVSPHPCIAWHLLQILADWACQCACCPTCLDLNIKPDFTGQGTLSQTCPLLALFLVPHKKNPPSTWSLCRRTWQPRGSAHHDSPTHAPVWWHDARWLKMSTIVACPLAGCCFPDEISLFWTFVTLISHLFTLTQSLSEIITLNYKNLHPEAVKQWRPGYLQVIGFLASEMCSEGVTG